MTRHRNGWITSALASLLLVWLVGAAAAEERGSDQPNDLLVVSVVSEDTDAFRRFRRSVERQGLTLVVIQDVRGRHDKGVDWRHRLDLIRDTLTRLEKDHRLATVLVVDGYNSIVNGHERVILDAFFACDCQILFAADDSCREQAIPPDTAAAVEGNGKPCVMPAAGFIGRVQHVRELLERQLPKLPRLNVSGSAATDAEEVAEQTYFARLLSEESKAAKKAVTSPFNVNSLQPGVCAAITTNASVAAAKRRSQGSAGVCTSHMDDVVPRSLNIRLDTNSRLFQSLESSAGQLEVQFAGTNGFLYNQKTDTTPSVIYGGRPAAKISLNSLGNYLAGEWSPSGGCAGCSEGRFSLRDKDGDRSHYPPVFAALFAEKPTPFLSTFYERFENLEHPPEKIDLFVFNQEPYNDAATKAFVQRAAGKYRSVKYVTDKIGIRRARNAAVSECLNTECLYFLSLDSEAQLTMPRALSLLIGQNRSIVAPLLTRPGRLWSNFWGALSSDGYYARSDDYLDLVSYRKIGLWHVPFIANAMLLNGSSLRKLPKDPYNYGRNVDDEKMSFCANAREAGIFMYIDNQHSYGHLINADDFNSTRASPELFELFSNTAEWRRKYLHPNYSEVVDLMQHVSEPCPDVYWFPMMSEAFCDDLVHMMESYGRWSNGDNTDSRLQGGYEAVPTRDIHMNQVGFELHWLAILQQYVQPVQRLLYTGYQSLNKALLNFVVRYRPDEQPSLRPHHDTSTFTINMALNTPGVDYEGGGVRFIRYNCSLLDLRKGWVLIHPGRLTHYHEGLATTKGTRYIMVSFVDP